MGIETATLISQLNSAWPLGADNFSEGDDHLRLIKSVLKGTFSDTTTTFTVTKGSSTMTFNSSGVLALNNVPIPKITVASTAPIGPAVNDVWIDTT